MTREYAMALLAKFPSLDPMWTDSVKGKWYEMFDKLLLLEKDFIAAYGEKTQVIPESNRQLVEMRTRLAATLGHFDNVFCAQMHSMLGLIERDSALKQENRSLLAEVDSLKKVARPGDAAEPPAEVSAEDTDGRGA